MTASLSGSNGDSPTILRRIAEAEGRATRITGRLAELEREIEAQGKTIDFQHLQATLVESDAVWDVMLPHEEGRLIYSLVQRVVCSPAGEVRIEFRRHQLLGSESAGSRAL